MKSPTDAQLDDRDYARLLEFRTAIRKFLKYSKQQAEQVGITPTQHQLLLAIRGHSGPNAATIGDVADCLLIRHHSAVELVDRAETAGLVARHSDPEDQRVVRLRLTRSGAGKLERISGANLRELARLTPQFEEMWQALAKVTD